MMDNPKKLISWGEALELEAITYAKIKKEIEKEFAAGALQSLFTCFTDEDVQCIIDPQWWSNEVTKKISTHAAGVLYNYIAYLESLANTAHAPDEGE